jgi:hypothetical protein
LFSFRLGIVNSVEMLVAGSIPAGKGRLCDRVCQCSHTGSSVWATYYLLDTEKPLLAFSALKQYWRTDGHVFSRLFDSCVCFVSQAIRHAILSADTHERESDRNVTARHKELISVTWLSVVHDLHYKIIGLFNITFSSLLLSEKTQFFINSTHCKTGDHRVKPRRKWIISAIVTFHLRKINYRCKTQINILVSFTNLMHSSFIL